jgi:ABC-type lipoprotein export system ATPase subunit
MLNVISEIIRWAKSLKYWEQATLDKILGGEPFTDETYQELYRYFLEDVGLQKKSEGPRPKLQSLDETKIPEKTSPKTIRLSKISNLQNINALVKDQQIPFSPQLTAIYGANASGKSGYARVLGCAGFTRGDRRVFPNIADESGPGVQQSADIQVCSEDRDKDVCYLVGDPNPGFSFCHVFDSTSVNVHLTKPNEFSFSPAGLESLARLAEETDVIRKMLRDKIAKLRKPHDFNKYFVGEESVVSELIRNLSEKTDTEEMDKLANVTQADEKRAEMDDKQLSFLKSLNIDAKVKAYNKNISDLNGLKAKLVAVGEQLKDEFFTALNDSIKSYVKISQLAKQMGVDQFRCDYFKKVGSDEWYDFIMAAKDLAEAEGVPPERERYPLEGERCLFCRQVLSSEALYLIRRIWKFLEDDVQKRLKDAETLVNGLKDGFHLVDTDFFGEDSVYYRLVQENKTELLEVIQSFLTACASRKSKGLEFIKNLRSEALSPLPGNGAQAVDKIIRAITTQRDALLKKDPTEEIDKLEKALMVYRHRLILKEIKQDVVVYVGLLVWASAASTRIGNTSQVTRKHDELFEKVVTEGYVGQFNGVLNELDPKINVKIDTIPRKGATYKQIVLDKCVPSVPDATPDKILSEGEKRAVSLADFLTEADIDPACNSIVLDDPVTSFDLEWRKKVAPIFAKEAANRQVIIFTHDLAFLYHLIEAAEKEGVEILCHWIQRGWRDGMPGYVSIDNSPAIDRSFRKPTKAQQLLQRAKDEPDFSERERLLKDGFSSLRTCYEAFIVYEMFNEVIQRFSERISFGRLAGIVWDEAIVKEAMDKYEDLSMLMEGHLHSERFAYEELTPDILDEEIKHFAGLKKQLKDLKKEKTAA